MFTLLQSLFNRYNAVAYTHEYIVGFAYKGVIYYTAMNAESVSHFVKLDKASRGAGYSVRFQPTTDQKVAMLPKAKVLCSKVFFDETVATTCYNKGEIFEKLLTEKAGQVWTKDHVPFTEAGDLVVNGTAYQIKFERATFCNEKTLATLGK